VDIGNIGMYTLSEAWSGVNWADVMSILRPNHRAYYRSGIPAIKIGPKGALGSHEIRPIHSAPNVGQSIGTCILLYERKTLKDDDDDDCKNSSTSVLISHAYNSATTSFFTRM